MPKADNTHSIAVLNGQADQITGHPRFMHVEGDSMEPTLTFRHLAAVVPVAEYCGEGIYVLDVLGQPDYVRCDAIGPDTIRLTRDNPRYNGSTLTLASFEAALLGRVAAICNVVDPTLFGSA